jgi:hypothetical protein
MTLIVNHSGQVFEKDRGSDTANIAETMASFDPDPSWKKVEATEPPKQTRQCVRRSREGLAKYWQ